MANFNRKSLIVSHNASSDAGHTLGVPFVSLNSLCSFGTNGSGDSRILRAKSGFKKFLFIFSFFTFSCSAWQVYENEVNPYIGFPSQRANELTDYFFGNSPEGNMEMGPFIRAPFVSAY